MTRRRSARKDRGACKGCGTVVGALNLDNRGHCGSCEDQRPLFDLTVIRPRPRDLTRKRWDNTIGDFRYDN